MFFWEATRRRPEITIRAALQQQTYGPARPVLRPCRKCGSNAAGGTMSPAGTCASAVKCKTAVCKSPPTNRRLSHPRALTPTITVSFPAAPANAGDCSGASTVRDSGTTLRSKKAKALIPAGADRASPDHHSSGFDPATLLLPQRAFLSFPSYRPVGGKDRNAIPKSGYRISTSNAVPKFRISPTLRSH